MQRHGFLFVLTLGVGMLMLGNGAFPKEPGVRSTPLCPEPEARQFDFWLGTWNIENQQRLPSRPTDPSWFPTGTLQAHVTSTLHGCAILEQSAGTLVYGPVSGFSLRAYDPQQQRWVVVNNWSVGGAPPSFSTWEGTFHHGRIEGFDTTQTSFGELFIRRSTFSDITDSTFRWDAATSTDGRLTWKSRWIMEGRRLPVEEVRLPDPEGPPLCPDSVRHAVETLRGMWRGTVTQSADPALPMDAQATLDARGLHGGCALYSLLTVIAEDTLYQHARIRAPDAASHRWVQYSLDTQSRAFVRMEGPTPFLLAEGADRSTSQREVWTTPAADQLTLRKETQSPQEARWQVHAEMHWTRQLP